MILSYILYLLFYFIQTKKNISPLPSEQWLVGVHCSMGSSSNFKENFFFDLANPIENNSVFFNLSRVMTLSLEKDK